MIFQNKGFLQKMKIAFPLVLIFVVASGITLLAATNGGIKKKFGMVATNGWAFMNVTKQVKIEGSLASDTALLINETDGDTSNTGDSIRVHNSGVLPRDIFRLGRDGGAHFSDYIALNPSNLGIDFWCPASGNMLCVGSDLTGAGIQQSIFGNAYNPTFLQMVRYNEAGYDNGLKQFTFQPDGRFILGDTNSTSVANGVQLIADPTTNNQLTIYGEAGSSLGNIYAGTLSGQAISVTLPTTSFGAIAQFGANATPGLLSVGYDSAGTSYFKGSPYGRTELQSGGNNIISINPGGTGAIELGGIDTGTATSTIIFGDATDTNATCLKLADMIGAGYTYCTAQGGTLSCSTASCE